MELSASSQTRGSACLLNTRGSFLIEVALLLLFVIFPLFGIARYQLQKMQENLNQLAAEREVYDGVKQWEFLEPYMPGGSVDREE